MCLSFVREDFLGATRGTTEDDATARGPDEFDEVLHFLARERPVAFDLPEGARGIELGLRYVAARPVHLGNDRGLKTSAFHADDVQAEDRRRPAADRLRVRHRIFRNDRIAADECMPPDATELMN